MKPELPREQAAPLGALGWMEQDSLRHTSTMGCTCTSKAVPGYGLKHHPPVVH